MPRLLRLVPLFLIGTLEIAPSSGARWNPLNPVESFHKGSDGATIFLEKGAPRFQLCTNSMVRVLPFARNNAADERNEAAELSRRWASGSIVLPKLWVRG